MNKLKNPVEEIPNDLETPPRPVSEAKKRGHQIRGGHWRGSTPATLWVAHECTSVKWDFTVRGQAAFRQAADLSKTTFLQLAAIGSDWRMSRLEPLLPSSISTLHEITKLNNKTFDDAIKAGVIHPEVRHAEIKALRKAAEDKTLKREREDPTELANFSDIATGVRHQITISEEEVDRYVVPPIEEILSWLQTETGVRVVQYEFIIREEVNRFLCAQIEQILCWLQSRYGVQITLGQTRDV
jgi:hypothetical protein